MLEINRIYNQDCIEGMKLMDDESVDMVVTSPPYAVKLDYEEDQSFKQFLDMMDGVFEQVARVLKCGRYATFNFGDNSYGHDVLKTEVFTTIPMSIYYWEWGRKYNLELQATRIWRKNYLQSVPFVCNHHPRPVYAYEHLWTFRKPDGTGKEIVRDRSYSQKGVIGDDWVRHKLPEAHCFPEDLPFYFVVVYSDQGDLVLDPFMGCATTAKVCMESKRNYIGFEKEEKYYKACIKRLKGIAIPLFYNEPKFYEGVKKENETINLI